MCFESRETVEVVLHPFPHVAIDIVEPHGGGWEHVDGLCVCVCVCVGIIMRVRVYIPHDSCAVVKHHMQVTCVCVCRKQSIYNSTNF